MKNPIKNDHHRNVFSTSCIISTKQNDNDDHDDHDDDDDDNKITIMEWVMLM